MNYSEIGFDWRATMGNASALPADVADYLDLIASLVRDDGSYLYRTAQRHTCAADDPIVMLDHVRREGLCSTPGDHRLYDRALAGVRQHHSAFFCDAEIERRMKLADGACPMCGFEVKFHTGDYGDGYQPQLSHCQHNLGHHVKAADIDAYLRRPSSWQGSSWPYGYMQGNKLTRADGTPFSSDDCGRMPCHACREMEAFESMEKALFKLVASVGPDHFKKPGWSSPVSQYVCQWGTTDACKANSSPCDHVYMHVKRAMQKTLDRFQDSVEINLNGAGLKLYIRPARTGAFDRVITFGMRVGGDQVDEYPGFQAFAHQLFTEMGVPTMDGGRRRDTNRLTAHT